MIQDITAAKAQFRMDEPLKFEVCLDSDFSSSDQVCIHVYHLGHLCFRQEKTAEGRLPFQYRRPPSGSVAMEGFWVQAAQVRGGRIISRKSTACDRAQTWKEAPRYGFLSDFSRKDGEDDRDVRQVNRYHLNIIQFYDWMYRHHDFFPPQNDFQDIMGKQLSLTTIRQKISLLHQYGMKAFAYGSVYGAEEEYQKEHPEESLYDGTGKPMRFIDRIYYMDINRNCGWRDHIIGEYKKAIRFGFDGIHMDQYGFPKEAFSRQNGTFAVRCLRDDFPDLINDTKSAVPGGVIFNSVNNWPTDAVAKANQDCIYIEVWPPNDTYSDLNRLVSDAKKYAPEKQVILAAYLHPFAECSHPEEIMATAFLAMATIFSSGGFHLLLGEDNGLLTQAYYSDYCQLENAEFISLLKSYYDFITAYEELLFDHSLIDDTRTHTGGINDDYLFAGAEFSTLPETGCVWTQVKHTKEYRVIQLVNFVGIGSMNWNSPQRKFPDPIQNIKVDAQIAEEVTEVRLMSPDLDGGKSKRLDFSDCIRENGCRSIQFTIPELKVWNVISIQVKTI
jgi:dextranase